MGRKHTRARPDAVILLAEVARPNLKILGEPVGEELGDKVLHRPIMLSLPLGSSLDDETGCTTCGLLEGVVPLLRGDWIGGSFGWHSGGHQIYVCLFGTHIISSLMSSRSLTYLAPSDMIMDHRGERDPKYWCLPPFRGDPKRAPAASGYRYHLVWRGRTVGTFDTWCVEA